MTANGVRIRRVVSHLNKYKKQGKQGIRIRIADLLAFS
jgi:hypothetical protein